MSTQPEILASVYQLLVSKGLEKSAAALLKEGNFDKKAAKSAPALADVFTFYKSNNTNGKRKVEEKKVVTSSSESSSDSSSSDSDSDSEDEAPAKKPVPVNKVSAAVLNKKKDDSSSDSDSSSSSSDSDSDSEDEKPAAKKAAPAPAAKAAPVVAAKAAPAKKAESSDSDSSSSSDSSSDSSSESESEDEKPAPKKQKVESGAAAPVKTPAKAAPAAASSNGATHKAYVKGLPWVCSEDQLREFFVSCGGVVNVELPLQEDGRSSGTAYITFSERSQLDAALALDGSVWPGTERWLKILESTGGSRASMGGPGSQPGERPEGCDTIFVGNMPWDITEEQMYEIFGAVGEVSSVRFATSKEDNSFRGFGHVSFANADDVLEAIKLNGTEVNGRALRLDFAPPRNREGGAREGGFSPSGRGGGGRGGFGGGRGGGRGAGGRGGRGGSSAPTSASKNKGSIAGGAGGKKMTFDE